MACEHETSPKEPYLKPVVERVKIVPDELAATGCKTPMSMMGPTAGGCWASKCRLPGS